MTNDEVVKVLEERVIALNLYNDKTEYCKEEIKALCIAVATLKRIDAEKIAIKIEERISHFHKELFGNDVTDNDLAWYRKEIGKATGETIVNYLRGE